MSCWKQCPSYMSFRCWSEFWKVLNHHELVLGVTCKTSIEQKPSAHPSKHVTWIQFFALFFCLFLVLCFLCKFCATTCQGLPDATLSHSHRGPGPRFYRLFSDAARSSCQNGHDLYESDLVARIAASAGIWTGLDLTWWWKMSKNCTECDHLHWQCQLGKVSAYCFQRFYSWPQIDVATGSWNWGPSSKWRVGALELNNTPTTMLQPTHLKIHLDMFQFMTRKHLVSQTHDLWILSTSGPTYQWRVNTTCCLQITGVWFRHSYVIYPPDWLNIEVCFSRSYEKGIMTDWFLLASPFYSASASDAWSWGQKEAKKEGCIHPNTWKDAQKEEQNLLKSTA